MFVEARTRPVLAEVCRRLGYSDTDATLLRHHTNAVYAVRDVVVKIARPGLGIDRLRSVVAVVRWLVARGFPTVDLSPHMPQPLDVAGYAVTVWQRLDPALDNPVTMAELGALLRELHAAPAPPADLPRLRPIEGIHHSIITSTILAEEERNLLLFHLDGLAETWSKMDFSHATSLIQSDPQTRNALRRADRTAVLADWDGVAFGPREWDIATVAVHCRRFASTGRDTFAGFTAAYGWDATAWEGFENLCQLRELQMIATNARKSRAGTAAAVEVHRRIAGLQQGSRERNQWHIL